MLEHCPHCGAKITPFDYLYHDREDGTIIGCDNCIVRLFPEEFESEKEMFQKKKSPAGRQTEQGED